MTATALSRCDVLAGDGKSACQGRMMGRGVASGSVAGGGLLRGTQTVVPANAQ